MMLSFQNQKRLTCGYIAGGAPFVRAREARDAGPGRFPAWPADGRITAVAAGLLREKGLKTSWSAPGAPPRG